MDAAGIFGMGADLHCFDCSAIYEPINEALKHEDAREVASALVRSTFLPSPRTWIEWPILGKTTGVVLEMRPGGKLWFASVNDMDGVVMTIPLGSVDVSPTIFVSRGEVAIDPSDYFAAGFPPTDEYQRVAASTISVALLMLDIINQPALCHLRVVAPHRGLERDLRRALGPVGSYPLHAWHEVLIKTQDRPLTEEEIEGHLTGRKCLHFVRAHRRRYQDGKEVIVQHHWRGDPAIGIKRTRYRVEQ